MQMRPWFLLFFLVGCAHGPKERLRSELDEFSARLPACAVDVEASEVWIGLRWKGNVSLPYEGTPAQWRDAVADSIGRACEPQRSGSTIEPVRFRIYVDADITDGSFVAVVTPIQIIAAVLFIPIGGGSADVQLEYEYRGVIYRSFAHGHSLQGLFYNWDPSVPSFAEALQDAIEDIARQIAS